MHSYWLCSLEWKDSIAFGHTVDVESDHQPLASIMEEATAEGTQVTIMHVIEASAL